MTSLELRYFEPREFVRGGVEWYDRVKVATLEALDVLRHYHGRPIHVSPHPRAVGRPGSGSTDHDPDEHGGEVAGVDVFPEGVETPGQMREFIELAISVGFTALGVYPHWENSDGETQAGVHLAVRDGRTQDDPARWGMIRNEQRGRQRMVSMAEAINKVGTEPAHG